MLRRWVALLLLLPPVAALGGTFSDNFDSYVDIAAVDATDWAIGSEVSLESSGCRNAKCLRFNIPGSGFFPSMRHSLNEADVYIRFYAKRTNFAGEGGSKFLKLFGQQNGANNYANITFAQLYQNGQFYTSGSGDGSGLENDTICNWYWGVHSIDANCLSTTVTQTAAWSMAEGVWYCFEFHVKMNTDGNQDGIVEGWVDGVQKFKYTDVKMRNDANIRNFETMSFVDYLHDSYPPSGPYEIWFDDVVVATSGPIGPLSAAVLAPQTALSGGVFSGGVRR